MMTHAERALPVVVAIGFLGCGVGLWIEPGPMLASYLAVWFAVCAIPIGASGVLFTSYLVRGGWTPDLHAPLSNAALTMPFAAILFIPVLAGLSWIYPWAAAPTS